MREIRQSGSEGGGTEVNRFSLPLLFIGHCSLIDAPARFGAAPVCIEIEAIRTLPTIAGGDVFDTRPSCGNSGRSFHRRFAARSMTPLVPKLSTCLPVLASSATNM